MLLWCLNKVPRVDIVVVVLHFYPRVYIWEFRNGTGSFFYYFFPSFDFLLVSEVVILCPGIRECGYLFFIYYFTKVGKEVSVNSHVIISNFLIMMKLLFV